MPMGANFFEKKKKIKLQKLLCDWLNDDMFKCRPEMFVYFIQRMFE